MPAIAGLPDLPSIASPAARSGRSTGDGDPAVAVHGTFGDALVDEAGQGRSTTPRRATAPGRDGQGPARTNEPEHAAGSSVAMHGASSPSGRPRSDGALVERPGRDVAGRGRGVSRASKRTTGAPLQAEQPGLAGKAAGMPATAGLMSSPLQPTTGASGEPDGLGVAGGGCQGTSPVGGIPVAGAPGADPAIGQPGGQGVQPGGAPGGAGGPPAGAGGSAAVPGVGESAAGVTIAAIQAGGPNALATAASSLNSTVPGPAPASPTPTPTTDSPNATSSPAATPWMQAAPSPQATAENTTPATTSAATSLGASGPGRAGGSGSTGSGTGTSSGRDSAPKPASPAWTDPLTGPDRAAGTPTVQAAGSAPETSNLAASPSSVGAGQGNPMPAASGPAGASTEQDALALASRAGLSAHASPAVLAAHGASAATPAESAPASATGQATAADRLLGQVVDRLRTYQTQAGPVVESQLHTPELGTVQLVVAGRIGETIRAELVVADRQVADALSRSVDRAQSSGAGLVGMDVRIRVAQTDGRDAGTFDRGPGSQGTGRDTDQSLQHSAGGWPSGGGPAGAGAGHDGDGRPSSGAPLQAPVSITSTVPRAQPLPRLSSDGVVRLPFGGGSIDLRA